MATTATAHTKNQEEGETKAPHEAYDKEMANGEVIEEFKSIHGDTQGKISFEELLNPITSKFLPKS